MSKNNFVTDLKNVTSGMLVAQGVVAALFGIAILFWPGLTLALFVSLFGIFVIAWGLIGLINSLMDAGRQDMWWAGAAFSLLSLGLGVYLLRNPEVTGSVLIMLVGFTLILRGIMDGLTGLFDKETFVRENRWFYVVAGMLGLIAGVAVLAHPVATGLAFVWAVGLYLLLQSSLNIALAFRIREETRD